MKAYQLPDGTIVGPGDQFQIGNQKYPPGWIAHASAADVSNAGIVVVTLPDPVGTGAPQVPVEVDAGQFKIAVDGAGLTLAFNTQVNKASAAAQIYWNSYNTFRRDSADLNALATAAGVTSAQLDQLFITAASIFP